MSAGATLGSSSLTVVNAVGSDTEAMVGSISVTALAPAVVAIPGGTAPPMDTDTDLLYDDLNSKGRRDFADVVLYFNQMAWISANEPIAAFDCNGTGRIDFADIVWLSDHLYGPDPRFPQPVGPARCIAGAPVHRPRA